MEPFMLVMLVGAVPVIAELVVDRFPPVGYTFKLPVSTLRELVFTIRSSFGSNLVLPLRMSGTLAKHGAFGSFVLQVAGAWASAGVARVRTAATITPSET